MSTAAIDPRASDQCQQRIFPSLFLLVFIELISARSCEIPPLIKYPPLDPLPLLDFFYCLVPSFLYPLFRHITRFFLLLYSSSPILIISNIMSLALSDNLAPQPITDVFTDDTNIDRRKCHRTVPMKVLALGVGRTGTACKLKIIGLAPVNKSKEHPN